MIEELIRIENGTFLHDGKLFQIDVSVSGGFCVGLFTDNHMLAGSAYHGIFGGQSSLKEGRAFVQGKRVSLTEAEMWIRRNSTLIDRNRFDGRELTARDYVTALGRRMSFGQRKDQGRRMNGEEAATILKRMGIRFRWEDKLNTLSILEYYKLAVFRAWFIRSSIVVLDRITEILRQQDLREFMTCVQIFLEQGAGVVLLDLDERFLFEYANRVDVMKNRKLVYRLFPDDYGDRLYEILGWEPETDSAARTGVREAAGPDILTVKNLRFDGLQPMDFVIRSGEIGFLTDENYQTGDRIRDCFLGKESWISGELYLNGKKYERPELLKLVGSKIGIQVAMPDRKGGVLFDNFTALENLSTSLVPKAGKHLFRRSLVDNIQNTASKWFGKEELQKPVSDWTLPQRLRLSYMKWYLMRPDLLICLFPFAGQESLHHEMIIQLLVMCARRGMAVWIISSGIEAICEHTENEEFIRRLRYLD